MAQVKNGDTVRVHYTGKFDDGTLFDSSHEREPLEFTIGREQVIPGFEKAVIGMSPGESRNTTVPTDQAYGECREDMILEIDRDTFPKKIDPEIGHHLHLNQSNGETIIVTVIDVSESCVTLDANHPLAGKNLTYDIELLKIV